MGISRSGSLICDLESSRAQETSPLDKKSGTVFSGSSFWSCLRGREADPRQLELEEADWKALFEHLRRIFSRLASTLFGSVAALILAAIVLVPRVGWTAGLVLSAGLMSVFWTVLDRARRNI
jgi:hypothetical protein